MDVVALRRTFWGTPCCRHLSVHDILLLTLVVTSITYRRVELGPHPLHVSRGYFPRHHNKLTLPGRSLPHHSKSLPVYTPLYCSICTDSFPHNPPPKQTNKEVTEVLLVHRVCLVSQKCSEVVHSLLFCSIVSRGLAISIPTQ